MNRRSFLVAMSALPALRLIGQSPVHATPIARVYRKKLSPQVRVVSFSVEQHEDALRPFLLRSKGNAIWIESASWVDRCGNIQTQIFGKNLPMDMDMALPEFSSTGKITIAVTCLPLAKSTTWLELVG